jgi:hypothetical protein
MHLSCNDIIYFFISNFQTLNMDKFHSLMALVDKNADILPDGDYLQIANLIKEIRDKVKPPRFLPDQNEPMTMPEYEPTQSSIHSATPDQSNVTVDVTLLHADWSNTDNARYADYEESEDEDDAPEHIGYRLNTVPDTLEADDIPEHIYDTIISSRDSVTMRRINEGDRNDYYEVAYPDGSTTVFASIHR